MVIWYICNYKCLVVVFVCRCFCFLILFSAADATFFLFTPVHNILFFPSRYAYFNFVIGNKFCDLNHMQNFCKIIDLQERLGKEKEIALMVHGGAEGSSNSSNNSSSCAGPTTVTPAQRRPRSDSSEPDVNGEWLLQLMDMGFSREHCVEALLHTPNVEQATDYLLSNPSPFVCTTQVLVTPCLF